jgi:hypothetical protein
VVFAFQLWWMLALRFCFPPSSSFTALSDFFTHGNLTQLEADPVLNPEFDRQFGLDSPTLPLPDRTPGWAHQLNQATDSHGPIFQNDPNFVKALVVGTDPTKAVLPTPPELLGQPDDPLCP